MKKKVLTRRQFNISVASTVTLLVVAPVIEVEASMRKRRARTPFRPAVAAFAIGSLPLNGSI